MTFDPAFEEFKRKRELERSRREGRGEQSDPDLHLPKRKRITPAPSAQPTRRRSTTRKTNILGGSSFGL